MTCREVTELITDYLEGKLSLWDRVRFHYHLGLCVDCRTHLRQMRQTIATLGRLPIEPIPQAVRDELLRRFRAWKKS